MNKIYFFFVLFLLFIGSVDGLRLKKNNNKWDDVKHMNISNINLSQYTEVEFDLCSDIISYPDASITCIDNISSMNEFLLAPKSINKCSKECIILTCKRGIEGIHCTTPSINKYTIIQSSLSMNNIYDFELVYIHTFLLAGAERLFLACMIIGGIFHLLIIIALLTLAFCPDEQRQPRDRYRYCVYLCVVFGCWTISTFSLILIIKLICIGSTTDNNFTILFIVSLLLWCVLSVFFNAIIYCVYYYRKRCYNSIKNCTSGCLDRLCVNINRNDDTNIVEISTITIVIPPVPVPDQVGEKNKNININNNNNNNNNSISCPICYESFNNNINLFGIFQPCHHTACKACISKLIGNNNNNLPSACHICRKQVSGIIYPYI